MAVRRAYWRSISSAPALPRPRTEASRNSADTPYLLDDREPAARVERAFDQHRPQLAQRGLVGHRHAGEGARRRGRHRAVDPDVVGDEAGLEASEIAVRRAGAEQQRQRQRPHEAGDMSCTRRCGSAVGRLTSATRAYVAETAMRPDGRRRGGRPAARLRCGSPGSDDHVAEPASRAMPSRRAAAAPRETSPLCPCEPPALLSRRAHVGDHSSPWFALRPRVGWLNVRAAATAPRPAGFRHGRRPGGAGGALVAASASAARRSRRRPVAVLVGRSMDGRPELRLAGEGRPDGWPGRRPLALSSCALNKAIGSFSALFVRGLRAGP